jgi:UV DNA damage endonuclease
MHPDQFTLINSREEDIFRRSEQELRYHAQVLDLMQLDATAKIQIHVGGVYGDKDSSIQRFIERYRLLDGCIKKRLIIENDERSYTLVDCMRIHKEIGIPVLFDVLHHQANNDGLSLTDAFRLFPKTWRKHDGLPMVDYSSQERGGRLGKHAVHINVKNFSSFLRAIKGYDVDIMLEIKDKEKSCLQALAILKDEK